MGAISVNESTKTISGKAILAVLLIFLLSSTDRNNIFFKPLLFKFSKQSSQKCLFNGILDSENGVFIPKNSELYELLNLNIICYLEECLDYREMKLITYKTSDGIYFNSKFKEYILGIKL